MLFVTGVERDNVNKLNVSMYIEAQGKYFEKKVEQVVHENK